MHATIVKNWSYSFRLQPARIATLVLLISSPSAAETIYKCVDTDGQITFQSRACEGNKQSGAIEYQQPNTGRQVSKPDHKEIDDLSKKANIRYYERKIKYADNQIESLRLAKQKKVDYWRGVMMIQQDEVQTRKVEEIINSVSDDYDRKIEKAINAKKALEKRLEGLK